MEFIFISACETRSQGWLGSEPAQRGGGAGQVGVEWGWRPGAWWHHGLPDTHTDKDQLLQGTLPARASAVPPAETGDTELGDTTARCPGRFRAWDSSAGLGCWSRVEGSPPTRGTSATLTPHRPSSTQDVLVPLPQTDISEGTEIVQSPHDAITLPHPPHTHLLC